MDLCFGFFFPSCILHALSYVLRTDIFTVLVVIACIVLVGDDKQISNYLGSDVPKLTDFCMHLYIQWC